MNIIGEDNDYLKIFHPSRCLVLIRHCLQNCMTRTVNSPWLEAAKSLSRKSIRKNSDIWTANLPRITYATRKSTEDNEQNWEFGFFREFVMDYVRKYLNSSIFKKLDSCPALFFLRGTKIVEKKDCWVQCPGNDEAHIHLRSFLDCYAPNFRPSTRHCCPMRHCYWHCCHHHRHKHRRSHRRKIRNVKGNFEIKDSGEKVLNAKSKALLHSFIHFFSFHHVFSSLCCLVEKISW